MKIEDIKYEFPKMPEEMRAMIRDKVAEQIRESTADDGECPAALATADKGREKRSGGRGSWRKRTVFSLLAATLVLGTTAFAGMNLYQMYTERVGKYGMKTVAGMDDTTVGQTETAAAEGAAWTGELEEYENVMIRADYLPEGMVESPWKGVWYYEAEPGVGGITSCLFKLDADDSFEVVDKDILTSESLDVNGHSGVYLTRRVDELGTNEYDKIIYVMYPEAQLVLQLYAGENVSREEVIRFAEGIKLEEQGEGEEAPRTVAWKDYIRSITEPETEIYQAKLRADKEEMANTREVGQEFPMESFAEDEEGETGIIGDIAVKVDSVQIEDDLNLLDAQYMDTNLADQVDEQGMLLPNEIQYIRRGDGIDSTDEILKTETVPQKLVYVSVDYKNTGENPLYNILFMGNLVKIQETADGFEIFNRETARGGEACNKLSCSGSVYTGEMQYYDVRSSAGYNGSNYIDELQPGESVTVHMGFVVNEDELGYLYLDLSGSGGAYEFMESSLENGYVDIRQ